MQKRSPSTELNGKSLEKKLHTKQTSIDVPSPEQQEIDSIRNMITAKLQSAANSSASVMTRHDADMYIQSISDSDDYIRNLDDRKKLAALRPHIGWANQFVVDGSRWYQDLREATDEALKSGAITKEMNMKIWQRNGADLQSIKLFFEEKLPKLKARWKTLGTKIERVKVLKEKLGVSVQGVPSLARIDSGDARTNYNARVAAVEEALTALKKLSGDSPEPGEDMEKILKAAQTQFTQWQKDDIISSAYVWMNQLKKKKLSVTELQTFIEGIPKRMNVAERIQVRDDFREMHRRVRAEGKPHNLSVLQRKDFFGMKHPRRKQYVRDALAMLNGVDREHEMISEMETLITSENWEEAKVVLWRSGYLLSEPKNLQKLSSIKNAILQHDMQSQKKELTQETADLIKDKEAMDKKLKTIQKPVGSLYQGAYEAGTLATAMGGTYNVIWAHDNGFVNDNKLNELRESAEEDTQQLVEEGHTTKEMENVDLSADVSGTHSKVSDYQNRWGPTYVHYNENTIGQVVRDTANNRGNHDYWILYAPKGMEINEMENIVEKDHPVIFAGLEAEKKLQQRSITIEAKKESEEPEESYAVAV